jgi:hypothetical protein
VQEHQRGDGENQRGIQKGVTRGNRKGVPRENRKGNLQVLTWFSFSLGLFFLFNVTLLRVCYCIVLLCGLIYFYLL